MATLPLGRPGEEIGMDQCRTVDRGGEEIAEPAREVEGFLGRHPVDADQQRRRTRPPDLDPAEQIGLGTRHLEDALRLEARMGSPEDLRVGPKAHLGAAPVRRAPQGLELALGLAALEHLGVERLAARDLDLEPFG